MSYHPCVSGCGRSLAPQDGHDHCLTCLGIQHAEEAFVDGSCSSCGDMTISELRNRLRCVKHGGVPLPLPRSGVRPGTRGGTASGGVRGDLRIMVRASPSGVPHPSGTPQPAVVPLVRIGASAEWGTPPVSFGASPDDQMSVAASEGEPSLSGDDDSAALPPSGVVALSEPDPEMTAMLSRAAENVGLVWNPPPRPDPSRLDEWFLGGGGHAGFQRPPPVPFFPEVHEELTRSWKAPFTARNKPCGSSPLTTLDGGAALGYTGIPSVERSVAMQLCPTVASTLRGEPCLPSRACKYSSGLTGSAYRACGEAASALHAMALLQVHQAKALRDLHEGGHDLAVLHELRAATDLAHFWMRPSPRLVCSDRPEGRVLSCLDPPATHAIPAFRVRGTGVSVQGPALRAVPVASRLHQSRGGGPCPPERTRCAHSQLPRRLAHTRTVSQAVVRTQRPGAQAPQPAGLSGQLGKEQTRANAEDLFSRHGVRFGQPNSTPHPGTCSVSAELLQDLIRQDGGSTETLSEAPGAYGCSCGDSSARSAPYETASALALWPNPEVGVETRHLPGSDYTGLPQDLQAVVRSLVPSGRSAPGTGIQTCCGIHRCLDHRLGSHVQRACSIRGLDGSPTALAYQLPRVASSTPCPEPSQRAPSAQGRSGPYGQHCDRCVYQPARRFALPSHVATRLPPPPLESEASEVPSCHPHPRSVQSGSRRAVSSSTSRRVETPSPGGSADLGTVRSCSGRPVCISRNHPLPRVLLPNRGNARHGCTGTQLAPGPAQICIPPSEHTSTDTVQDQGGRGAGLVSGSILAQQDLVPRTHASRDSPSLANSSEEGSAFSETGHPMAPAPGPVETPRMVPGWDAEVLADLPQEVALTITSARAPSTRRAYTLKWNLFVEWCSSHQEDPRRCLIRAVLSFLQQGLERRLSPSTLKVYVAAISAYHDPVEGKSVGKHNLVVRFLRGARRLNPLRPPSLPSWDLALVLRALITAPFEPLQSVELKFLSMKTLLLTELASIKRVGDLQTFSVDDSCLQFGPADSCATLRPRPGYVPKVPTTPFSDQVVNLQALPPEEADPALALLCPVRALRLYTDRTQSFRTSELRAALCLLRRTAEGEGCFQAEDGPLDSGCYHLGL